METSWYETRNALFNYTFNGHHALQPRSDTIPVLFLQKCVVLFLSCSVLAKVFFLSEVNDEYGPIKLRHARNLL